MLSFGAIIELIKSLPRLSVLEFRGLASKGYQLRPHKSSRYIQSLINEHYQISQKLKRIHVDNLSESECKCCKIYGIYSYSMPKSGTVQS